MAAAMTYMTLLEDMEEYCERHEPDFLEQRARFVMMAENRIAAEARGLGLMRTVTDDLVSGQAYLTKPGRWRETVSLSIGTGSGNNTRVFLRERSYEYCRTYWPDATQTSTPKFYGDWDYEHFVVSPTPSSALPYELIYHERPQPLDDTNQTNWTTQYAPQLLLYACLLETQTYLKRDDRIEIFSKEYDRALKQVEFEQKRRLHDRTMLVENA